MGERKLGRGLDSLLGDARAAEGEEILHIPLDRIRSNPFQPRIDFDEAKLGELAASVRRSGVLQPILVRPAQDGYEIVAGERRSRAARLAGLGEIPAIVRPYTDDESKVLSLVENIQRQDLNAIDRAIAYRRLVGHLGTTQEELAARLGIDRSSVSNMIRLLELPEEVQQLVRTGTIGMGHAKALLSFPDEGERLRMAERVVREDLSVRVVEELARRGRGPAAPKRRTNPRKSAQVAALEDELRGLLGTKVTIKDRRGKGQIQIEYYSPEEFERILEQIRGVERGFARVD